MQSIKHAICEDKERVSKREFIYAILHVLTDRFGGDILYWKTQIVIGSDKR